MRILFWSEQFWPNIGGAEIIALKLILALSDRGYEFAVVTRKDSPDLPSIDRYKGISIYRFPFWKVLIMTRNLDRLMLIRRQVADLKRKFEPDIVHINGLGPTTLFFHSETKEVCPAPCLITLHQGIKNSSMEMSSLALADWVAGCSEATLDEARKLNPAIRSRSSVIRNGIEQLTVLPSPLPFDPPKLLCLGRLATQKGFDVALTAFASIVDRYPHVRLVLAGDGPERLELERQAQELGIIHAVDFLGWVAPEMIPEIINTSTIVLMPSRWEGLPLVALEVGLMARPIVATPVDGLTEVIEHQRTGVLVEPEDSVGFSEAIEQLLDNPERAKNIGHEARRRIRRVFSFERHVNAYNSLYRKLNKEQYPIDTGSSPESPDCSTHINRR